MKFKWGISECISAVLLSVSVVLLAAALSVPRLPGDTDAAARRLGRVVEKRLALLDKYVDRPEAKLPADMVIYCYGSDSLEYWRNQFPVANDDIRTGIMLQRLVNPRGVMFTPLAEVGENWAFHNFGTRWYVARRHVLDDRVILEGLEIADSRASSYNGANPRLRLGDKFTVRPLSNSGGSAVQIDGEPCFKVAYESLGGGVLPANPSCIWMAFLLFLAAVMLFLNGSKTPRRFVIAVLAIVVSMASMHIWGHTAQSIHKIFSPALFAGHGMFCSLGAVVIFNLAILLLAVCCQMMGKRLFSSPRTRLGKTATAVLAVAAVLAICIYTALEFHSIIKDSSITLELYKLPALSVYTLLVYASFMTMLLSVPMILQMRFGPMSLRRRTGLALLMAAGLVTITSISGFDKEKSRLEIMSNRLAVDRDISLELQLRRVEPQIAGDLFISSLSALDNAVHTIHNRLADNYFSRLDQDYVLNVYLLHDMDTTPQSASFFNSRISSGEAIAPNSRFIYTETDNGPRYDGVFLYYNGDYGLSRLIVEVEPKIGATASRRASVPSFYSYARYRGEDLKSFHGNYPYPTVLEKDPGEGQDGYVHFVNQVTDEETVIISRQKFGLVNYIISVLFLALLEFLLFFLVARKEQGMEHRPVRNFYRTRVISVLFVSLTLTLVVMATVSVVFVYRLNASNITKIMSDSIGSLQSSVQGALKDISSVEQLDTPQGKALLTSITSESNSQISLYRPDGRLLTASGTVSGQRRVTYCRMDETAWRAITGKRMSFYYQKEKQGQRGLYCIYAPILGESGKTIAILRSPYSGGDTFSFERDAVIHSVTIFTAFLILLILAGVAVAKVIDRMLNPLIEMGRKMSSANLDSPELIQYDNDDEILPLVQAYNRMVTELSESSRQLAQAERDKAWSSMARQVAHEIKNPLTPMKLQLQRIIRLKQKDAPDWQDKFDEVTAVLLDHIDILTETANEFSTFAKLYSEEPTTIDLDKVLREEMSMFDNREDIRFDYMGLSGVTVTGPKPQLTRVFVNLINNAVQAVDGMAEGGRVVVSLRNSVQDGWYDIVFEDNGPGVSEENVSKLFTPNFTTKSGGTGLGLAISRSVLERCGATISYSRSFVLGGACFTIRYPKDSFA